MNIWFWSIVFIRFLPLYNHLKRDGEPVPMQYSFFGKLIVTLVATFFLYMAVKTGF